MTVSGKCLLSVHFTISLFDYSCRPCLLCSNERNIVWISIKLSYSNDIYFSFRWKSFLLGDLYPYQVCMSISMCVCGCVCELVHNSICDTRRCNRQLEKLPTLICLQVENCGNVKHFSCQWIWLCHRRWGKCERETGTWFPAMWVSALNFVIEISWSRKCDKPPANVVWQDIMSCTEIFVALSASWLESTKCLSNRSESVFLCELTGWHAHSCTRMHVHEANANYIESVAATKCDTTSNTK